MSLLDLVVRDHATIIAELEALHPQRRGTKRLLGLIDDLVGADYAAALQRVGQCEIAADFVFLGPPELRLENSGRDCPGCELGRSWWLFATAGSGDGWLLRGDGGDSIVSFLDHDEESAASPRPLGVGFRGWLQLADVLRQVEAAVASDASLLGTNYRLVPRAASALRAAMRSIDPSLLRRYPYSI